jgi:hypothetical protein
MMQRVLHVADLRRLPVGTRLYLVHSLLGPLDPPELRVLHEVRSADLLFTGDGIREGRFSYLRLPRKQDLVSTERGFRVMEEGEVAAEYVFAEGDEAGA